MAKLIYTAFGNRVIGPAIADWLSSVVLQGLVTGDMVIGGLGRL